MKRSAILVHGYGVRGFFWSALKEELREDFGNILTPDFEIESVNGGVATLVDLAHRERERSGEAVVLVGHSLGGVLAALAAQQLSREEVSHLVIIASPYGNMHSGGVSKLLRLAVRFKIIPGWMIRPRFFGPAVPKEKQKELFSKAVKESEGLQDLSRQERWFHTGAFPEPLEQAILVLASEGDQIVNPEETMAFGRELRAETLLLPRAAGVGHNDFGYWPPAAKKTADEIRRFMERR
jgi:predicted alpha/beta hydrolase family esterase